jgi:PelA/Pel-15E family pectate lyase
MKAKNALCACLAFVALLPVLAKAAVTWDAILQQPDEWYASPEAVQIAENVLLHQTKEGGWPKNREMTQPPPLEPLEPDRTWPTIDNGATYTQIRYLARVQARSAADTRFTSAVLRGIDYLFAAQYENGGWPQFFPLRAGYYTHITFNDDAMVGVLGLLRDVAAGTTPFAFVDETRRKAAARAVDKGIACILRCQVRVKGRKTAWCAQHDATTFSPVSGRKYEHASLSGLETVGIVRFLMTIEPRKPEITEAVETAVAWLKAARLSRLRLENISEGNTRGVTDVRVAEDAAAPPLWARFYEIGTNRPIFSGRDGIVRYQLSEVEQERRANYRWYTDEPAKLLEREYPAWLGKSRGKQSFRHRQFGRRFSLFHHRPFDTYCKLGEINAVPSPLTLTSPAHGSCG